MEKIQVLINDHKSAIPVSVIIPLQEKRINFFNYFVLPLLKQSGAREIIINCNEGNAAKKRNEGFEKSTQPFICFCDDDKLLGTNYLQTLLKSLKDDNTIDFVYTGYFGIVIHTETHPCKNNYRIHTQDFDVKALKNYNYIDTTSLIRRDAFLGFDETLLQHDDWDMYLKMVSNGSKGKAVHDINFFSFYMDEGITSVNNKDCSDIVREKYK